MFLFLYYVVSCDLDCFLYVHDARDFQEETNEACNDCSGKCMVENRPQKHRVSCLPMCVCFQLLVCHKSVGN